MAARLLKDNVYAVGVVDWDRTLFDALVPLPHGTSYNAYVVKGSEKTALIDTVEPEKRGQYFANLDKLCLEKVDYIISNHAEQDHSGLIPEVLSRWPEAKVVTNAKCKELLLEHIDVHEEQFLVIENRQTLTLGDKTLEFIFAPWVHWPETMFTYLREDQVLFSCDFLGSHLAESTLFAGQRREVYEEAKRYFAEIMMPFSRQIIGHLKTLEDLELSLIAPSHGPVYDEPQWILDAYEKWVSGEVKNQVLLLYVSMHGSTEQMALRFIDALTERGVEVLPFNMVTADIGKVAMAAVDSATLVVASPSVLNGLHPSIAYGAFLLNSLKPKTRYAAFIGSYGWASKFREQLEGLLSNLKAEFLPPVLMKGRPKDESLEELGVLADRIAENHRSL